MSKLIPLILCLTFMVFAGVTKASTEPVQPQNPKKELQEADLSLFKLMILEPAKKKEVSKSNSETRIVIRKESESGYLERLKKLLE